MSGDRAPLDTEIEQTLPSPHFGTEVYAEISAERARAHAKHGRNSMESRPVGDFLRYTILAEEVGEIAKEFNEAEARGGQQTLDLALLRKECVQVATMAAAWADRLGFEIGRREQAAAYPAGHGYSPATGPFATGEGCRVMLARYPCNYSREQHDPSLPPEDLDVFGYRRGRR